MRLIYESARWSKRLSAHRDGDGVGGLMRVETAPQPACRQLALSIFTPPCGDARDYKFDAVRQFLRYYSFIRL